MKGLLARVLHEVLTEIGEPRSAYCVAHKSLFSELSGMLRDSTCALRRTFSVQALSRLLMLRTIGKCYVSE